MKQNRKLIIDGSSIRDGGSITHISEILNVIEERNVLFDEVIIFSNKGTLQKINDRKWLTKKHHPYLDKSLPFIILWNILYFKFYLKNQKESILLDPAGRYIGSFYPFISMSRNMLIFDERERNRYGFSRMKFKFKLLRKLQMTSFERAKDVIFISDYARQSINSYLRKDVRLSPLIHHGVNNKFAGPSIGQRGINEYDFTHPFRFLYVSTISVYKHQRNLIQAFYELRRAGFPVTLDLVGGAYPPELKKFESLKKKIDPKGNFIFYHGKQDYENIQNFYRKSDGVIFASTCENMPNVLIESMKSGLPVLCSNFPPMPEFIGADYKFYFNPLLISSIKENIRLFLESPEERNAAIVSCQNKVSDLTWFSCAKKTFSILYSNLIK